MKEMDYVWHLRAKMAERGMFATTDLPLLAERGVALSREQTYRLVTGQPQRLSMVTLIALCDILECTPNDLIEPHRRGVRQEGFRGSHPAEEPSIRPPNDDRRPGHSK